MRRLHVRELIGLPMIETHIFHESGEYLVSSADGFGAEHVLLFEDAGIEFVFALDGYDNLVQFSIDQRNKFILTNELSPDHEIVGPIVGPKGEILVRHGQPVGDGLLARLKRAGFYSVAVKKGPADLRLHEVRAYRRLRREGRRGRSGRRAVRAI